MSIFLFFIIRKGGTEAYIRKITLQNPTVKKRYYVTKILSGNKLITVL